MSEPGRYDTHGRVKESALSGPRPDGTTPIRKRSPLGGNSAERKAVPMYSGLLAYFPDALAAVAHLSFLGNEKHNPGQPLHWSRDKSADHLDCIIRHATQSGLLDADGELHDVMLAWRALANLQLMLEARYGLPVSPGARIAS